MFPLEFNTTSIRWKHIVFTSCATPSAHKKKKNQCRFELKVTHTHKYKHRHNDTFYTCQGADFYIERDALLVFARSAHYLLGRLRVCGSEHLCICWPVQSLWTHKLVKLVESGWADPLFADRREYPCVSRSGLCGSMSLDFCVSETCEAVAATLWQAFVLWMALVVDHLTYISSLLLEVQSAHIMEWCVCVCVCVCVRARGPFPVFLWGHSLPIQADVLTGISNILLSSSTVMPTSITWPKLPSALVNRKSIDPELSDFHWGVPVIEIEYPDWT